MTEQDLTQKAREYSQEVCAIPLVEYTHENRMYKAQEGYENGFRDAVVILAKEAVKGISIFPLNTHKERQEEALKQKLGDLLYLFEDFHKSRIILS